MKPNPELYKRMAEPYPSNDEARAALVAFLEDVAKAREQHRIAEVATIACVYASRLPVAMTQTMGDHSLTTHLTATLHREAMLSEARRLEAEAAAIREAAGERGEG